MSLQTERGYSCEGDIVTLRMTRDDYLMLLMLAGYGTSSAGLRSALSLMNRINAGNPNFTPYEVPVSEA